MSPVRSQTTFARRVTRHPMWLATRQRENFGPRVVAAPKKKAGEFLYCEADSRSRRESWDQAPVRTAREFPDSRWSSRAQARRRRKKPKRLLGRETNKEASGDASGAAKRFDCSGGNRKKQKGGARFRCWRGNNRCQLGLRPRTRTKDVSL